MSNPLIIISIIYIMGIISGGTVSFPIWFLFLLTGFLLALTIFAVLLKNNICFLISGLFFLIGMLNLQIRDLPPSKNDISSVPKKKFVTLVGMVEDEPRLIEDRVFFTLKVNRANDRVASGLVSVMAKASELEYGDKIEVKGKLGELESLSNPGILSFADYLKNKGVHCQLRSSRSPPKVLSNGGNPLKKLSIRLKDRLMVVPQRTLPEPYATLLTSIVFGSRAAKTPVDIKETYKRAGVAHLLVASGMHLGILVGVCLFVVRSTKLPLWSGVLIVSIVNLLYALMTGFGPSILRAAIMAEIMLVGLLFEREKEVYTSLAAAAFVILLFNPKYLFEVGFQLSFAATWALVYIAPVIHEKLKSYLPRSVSSLVSVAVSPVLATFPITLYHFSQASLIGMVTNFLLLPWIGMVVILGFVSTVLGTFFLPLGELINGANLILLWAADLIINFLASLPFAQIFVAPPRIPSILGYYVIVVGMVEVLRNGKLPKINKFRLIVLFLAIASIFLWNAIFSGLSGGLTVTVLDVGQGDSILIESPSGKKVLVDGGERKAGEQIVVPFLRRKGIQKLDMVVLTHAHEDHVGGLPHVLENIKVDSVLDTGYVYESKTYRRFLDLIRRNNIKYGLASSGQKIDFGGNTAAKVLHPDHVFLEECENINNASIVFRLEYGDFSMLFTGDNEREGEERILELFPAAELASTILKVGHHGSRTSTSPPFLAAVDPQVAVISCGRHNKFKHPHQSTLEKLRGVRTYRTDRHGAVMINSNGKGFRIRTAKD